MSEQSLAQLLKSHQQRQSERKRENGKYICRSKEKKKTNQQCYMIQIIKRRKKKSRKLQSE